MSYDVRECALEAAQNIYEDAEERHTKAAEDEKRKRVVFQQLKADYEKYEADALGLLGDELKKAKKEMKELDGRLRLARRDMNKAQRALERAVVHLAEAKMVYTHVERTYIPGCAVSKKPIFNLLASVKEAQKKRKAALA